jgi:MraZ protein
MDRFASQFVNQVDRKGRLSVPAAFRAVLKGQSVLRGLMSVDHPVVEIGGREMLEQHVRRLEQIDPLTREYELWSFYLEGDAIELKLDGEGRIQIGERVREHTGIGDEALFEGRGLSFWLWAPGKYEEYRRVARAEIRALRRPPGSVSGAPASGALEQGK